MKELKICNCQMCKTFRIDNDDFYDKLLLFWNMIEYYDNQIKEVKDLLTNVVNSYAKRYFIDLLNVYREKRNYWKTILKFVLDIVCSKGVYNQ